MVLYFTFLFSLFVFVNTAGQYFSILTGIEVVTKAGYYLIEMVTKAGYYLIEVVTKAGYYLIEVVT
jgi:hypothetical protein